jgi:hypothetical protein
MSDWLSFFVVHVFIFFCWFFCYMLLLAFCNLRLVWFFSVWPAARRHYLLWSRMFARGCSAVLLLFNSSFAYLSKNAWWWIPHFIHSLTASTLYVAALQLPRAESILLNYSSVGGYMIQSSPGKVFDRGNNQLLFHLSWRNTFDLWA